MLVPLIKCHFWMLVKKSPKLYVKRRISLKRGNFPALASAKNIEGWINSTSKSYTLRLIGVTPLRTEVYALLQFHRKLLATTKAQLVRWRTKKTRWHHVHYRFLAILRELCHLFWLKSFLASTTNKWVFFTLKIMNRPFKGYLPNSP